MLQPYEFYRAARQEFPVCKMLAPGLGQDVVLVTRYADVKDVFKRSTDFSSDFAHVLLAGAEPHPEADALFATGVKESSLLLHTDMPAHRRYKSIITAVINPRLVERLSAEIDASVQALIDGFIESGECDFVEEFAVSLPLHVIGKLMGVDPSDYPCLRVWSDAFILRYSQTQTKAEDLEAVRDIIRFQEYIKGLIVDRRSAPREDMISYLTKAGSEEGEQLNDKEILVAIQELLVAGNETSRNTLAGGLALFLENPDQIALLKQSPNLAANAVDEVLRLFTPVSGMWRIARHDTTLGGVVIPAGTVLLLRIESANRDEQIFPDPDRFDITRSNAKDHLCFGFGMHHCVGAMLSRREMSMAFVRLFDRLANIRLAPQSDLTRHHSIILRALNSVHIRFDPGKKMSS